MYKSVNMKCLYEAKYLFYMKYISHGFLNLSFLNLEVKFASKSLHETILIKKKIISLKTE